MRYGFVLASSALLVSIAVTARAEEKTATTPQPWSEEAESAGASSPLALYSPVAQGQAGPVLVSAGLRYRFFGPEIGDTQVATRLGLVSRVGVLTVAADATVGRGGGVRQDVDAEAGAVAYVSVAKLVRLGAEARGRGELAEHLVTAEDEGRAVEVTTGAMAAVPIDRVLVHGLGGWVWPRGPWPAAPAALLRATLSF